MLFRLGWCREYGYDGPMVPAWAKRPQARALLDEHTALRAPGTGGDLQEYRHSALTHLGEHGASPLMLMAKSRHMKPENVRRYFKPPPEAIAELTRLLAPGGSNRRAAFLAPVGAFFRSTARKVRGLRHVPSQARAATVRALTPVSRVGWVTGAKVGL